MSWIDKDDLVGWQAYFHERNRLIAALIHSPYAKGGRCPSRVLQSDVKHLVSLQYSPSWRNEALKDLLEGPADLHRIIGGKAP